jgi:hypothetical protein
MPREKTDNPAWRLYDLVDGALKTENGTIAQLWAAAFLVKPGNTGEIFRGLTMMHTLLDETEGLLRAADINHDFFLKNVSRVRQALSFTNMDDSAGKVASMLGGIVREIGYWAHEIDSTNFAARLTNDELSTIAADVSSVYERVRVAEIDEDLKRVVLDSLEYLRRAINDYRIRGSAGLQAEVERAAARLVRHAKDLRSGRFRTMAARLCRPPSES